MWEMAQHERTDGRREHRCADGAKLHRFREFRMRSSHPPDELLSSLCGGDARSRPVPPGCEDGAICRLLDGHAQLDDGFHDPARFGKITRALDNQLAGFVPLLLAPHFAYLLCPSFAHWSHEASLVHWSDTVGQLPGWILAQQRLRCDGRVLRAAVHESAFVLSDENQRSFTCRLSAGKPDRA